MSNENYLKNVNDLSKLNRKYLSKLKDLRAKYKEKNQSTAELYQTEQKCLINDYYIKETKKLLNDKDNTSLSKIKYNINFITNKLEEVRITLKKYQ